MTKKKRPIQNFNISEELKKISHPPKEEIGWRDAVVQTQVQPKTKKATAISKKLSEVAKTYTTENNPMFSENKLDDKCVEIEVLNTSPTKLKNAPDSFAQSVEKAEIALKSVAHHLIDKNQIKEVAIVMNWLEDLKTFKLMATLIQVP